MENSYSTVELAKQTRKFALRLAMFFSGTKEINNGHRAIVRQLQIHAYALRKGAMTFTEAGLKIEKNTGLDICEYFPQGLKSACRFLKLMY